MKLSPFWIMSFLLAFSSGLSAQTYLGISGGGGLPDQVIFRGAVPAEIGWKPNLSFQLEAVFIRRENYGIRGNLPAGRDYIVPVVNYLELPILLKAYLPFQFINFYVLAGPKVGYGLQMSATYLEDNILDLEKLEFRETGIHRLDFGMNIGGGIEKVISQDRKIFIDFRYYLGIHNINTEEGEEIFNEGKVFSLGFLVPIR